MESHGQIKLEWDKDILVLKATGPFNLEGMMDALNQIRESVNTANQASWKRLTILDTESLGSIETVGIMKQNYIWTKTHGCTATAVVVRSTFQTEIFDEIANGDSKQKTFMNEEDARTWLSSQE